MNTSTHFKHQTRITSPRVLRHSWPRTVGKLVIFALCCGLLSCSGDDEADDLAELAAGEASGNGSCVSCGNGSCGFCVEMSAERVYRCSGDLAPEQSNCLKTPSVFSENNVHYVCWYCK